MSDTQQRLEEIRKRVETADKEPWAASNANELIRHAREDVPWLLGLVEESRINNPAVRLQVASMYVEAKEENEKLRALLKKLEWRFPYVDEHRDNGHLACPVCHKLDKVGHKPDCELAAALGEQP